MNKNKQTPHLEYLQDEFGKEILLKDGSLQVMMEWEKPYMEACIDALTPKGDVLEIGFGLGYSATHIQKYHPKSHTIIECDPTVIQKAQEWAKNYSNIHIIEGYWQDQLKNLGLFDEIFFDDYTPLNAEEVEQIEKNITSLKKAEEAMHIVQQELKKMLEESTNQQDHDKRKDRLEESQNRQTQFIHSDRLIQFFQDCLDNHMRGGARMSSYIDYTQFKKQINVLEELIALHPGVTYTKKMIPIEVPSNCEYYSAQEAVILIISKMK